MLFLYSAANGILNDYQKMQDYDRVGIRTKASEEISGPLCATRENRS